MTDKVYIVTDLGPGDGGKGGVVHKIATMTHAHTVIKRGGAQGNHGIQTSKGEKFAFSQWGCGTLDGIPTHISKQMIVHPEGLLNEAEALSRQFSIYNPFDMLTIDEEALCATPFHGIVSHLKELSRGKNSRGTVGTGVGEAYRMYQNHPELSIMVRDLKKNNLKERLFSVREYLKQELQPIIDGNFLVEDQPLRDYELNLLYDEGFLTHILNCFIKIAQVAKIVNTNYLGEVILSKPGVAVVETSHGVLTDRVMGFCPHTSAIRTLPIFTNNLMKGSGYNGQIVNLGVTRAYSIRHGAGPIPTADLEMTNRLLPGSHKQENRWQGKVRVGPMDFVLLNYAIEVCGGPDKFDGLAISCFDQILGDDNWRICQKYSQIDNDSKFFNKDGKIIISQSSDENHLDYQTELTQRLLKCSPEIISIPIDPKASKEELFQLCSSIVNPTGVPVRMLSFGPTELDKFLK